MSDPDLVPGLTDLETALNGPDGAKVADDVLFRLQSRMKSLKELEAAGLRPQDFSRAKSLGAALEAATRIVVTPRKGA